MPDQTDLLPPKIAPRCGHTACMEAVLCRIITQKSGDVNVCKTHYHAYHSAVARVFCHKNGLLRAQDENTGLWVRRLKEWRDAHPMGRGKMHGTFLQRYQDESFRAERLAAGRDRIPGEDDE